MPSATLVRQRGCSTGYATRNVPTIYDHLCTHTLKQPGNRELIPAPSFRRAATLFPSRILCFLLFEDETNKIRPLFAKADRPGAWLGWLVRSARVQCEAVATIERAGGHVVYELRFVNGQCLTVSPGRAKGSIVEFAPAARL